MNSNLTLVREKVIAANPSILDLQFGCAVHWQKTKEGFSRIFVNFSEPEKFGKKYSIIASTDNLTSKHVKWGRVAVKTEDLIILGRPIRLTDVLLAMEGFGVRRYSGGDNRIGDKFADLFECWNLLDDDLSHQSQETIDFLAEILK